MPNLISQTATQIITSLCNVAIAMTHFIQAGAGRIYQAISALFSSGQPTVPSLPIAMEHAFTPGKTPDHEVLRTLPAAVLVKENQPAAPAEESLGEAKTDEEEVKAMMDSSVELQLVVPEKGFFRDVKTPEEEARRKWKISQDTADLLEALSVTSELSPKEVTIFAKMNKLLCEHGLGERDAQNVRFDTRLNNLISWYYGYAMEGGADDDVRLQEMLDALEGDIGLIEQKTWTES